MNILFQPSSSECSLLTNCLYNTIAVVFLTTAYCLLLFHAARLDQQFPVCLRLSLAFTCLIPCNSHRCCDILVHVHCLLFILFAFLFLFETAVLGLPDELCSLF